MKKGFVFFIEDKTIESVIEGNEKFVLEAGYNLIKNLDNTGFTFDNELLNITTDTNYINENME